MNFSSADFPRYVLLGLALVAIGGAILYLQGFKPDRGDAGPVVTLSSETRTADFADKAEKYRPAKELVSPDGYLNTDGQPFRLADVVGKKVVLIDFWTYSCINCQRTLPYLTRWYAKYRDLGLEIVGVHTPEFDFEKDIRNVERATKQYGVEYPVILDNAYATWDAYGNRYWPEHHIVDINGLVVGHHIGEGGYAETEREIQALLRERAEALGLDIAIPTDLVDVTAEVRAKSPETYFGSSRNELLANGAAGRAGLQAMTLPDDASKNRLYLGGTWDFAGESARSASAGARIRFRYDAGAVYLVASADTPVTLTVLRDGQPIGAERGEDVAEDGTVTVSDARLYKLVKEASPGEHVIEILVKQPGLEAFTFTFG